MFSLLSPVGIVVLILLVAGVALLIRMLARRGGSTAVCIHCGSTDMVEIDRQTIGTETVEQLGGGHGGGGDIRLRTEEEITYRCNGCQKSSTVRVRRTN